MTVTVNVSGDHANAMPDFDLVCNPDQNKPNQRPAGDQVFMSVATCMHEVSN